MKKVKALILIIIIAMMFSFIYIHFRHRELSDNMIILGQNKVFTPKGISDKYMYDVLGHNVWKFSLNEEEQELAEKYIDDNLEIWNAMSDYIIDLIEFLVTGSEKIGIDEISVENSYCSIVSWINDDFETDFDNGLNPKAVFIYDKLNKNYYCLFIANR